MIIKKYDSGMVEIRMNILDFKTLGGIVTGYLNWNPSTTAQKKFANDLKLASENKNIQQQVGI